MEELRFFNGVGGFSPDGTEYVIRLPADGGATRPPLPWVNVIANEQMGFLVSESGAASSWAANSRLNRLTPWANDPVMDPHGEALYLRDEDSGRFWSPTPGPVAGAGRYEVRHGFGYTRWTHTHDGLEEETLTFVPRGDGAGMRPSWAVHDSGTGSAAAVATASAWSPAKAASAAARVA